MTRLLPLLACLSLAEASASASDYSAAPASVYGIGW
jgi:hypothetical protein